MRKTLGILTGLLFFTFVQVSAQKKSLDKVAAVVGSSIILQSEIELQYAQYLAQGNPANPEVKCSILQSLLSQKILGQQAIIDSVTVTDDQIDGEIERRLRAMTGRAGGPERLEEFLGRSLIQYKDEIRPDIKEMLVAQKMQAKITENVAVTPLEIKRYFDAIPKDSLPFFNTEVEIAEIFLTPKLNKQEKEVFHDKAEVLRLRIKNGEDFATLARLYSQDPGSAREGGDLGFMDRTSLVKEFAATAFKLKPGELSQVIETEFGFHVMQLVERRGEQVNVRHILIKTEPTPASLERAKAHADSIYQQLIDKKIDFAAAASLHSDNNDTKYNGGMMLNAENVQSRTTYIPTDKLDPQVFLAVDTMKVGSISKPFLFTGADGKSGYRILSLKSKTGPHRASLEQDYPKIKEVAFEDKNNRTISEWFEKRRKITYIKIDTEYQTCPELSGWTTAKN
ncbi:peptidylprolyl isomerase [Daejeonella sp. H1SJ63]|uniref:peptidylprolyl isomerase n=1 Tax=Daejeonella sp. H1SJ63 TaxID=3034145 RepID=UPI0023ED4078|nr:peptidylprolyl isomerase [Daejeonella sp. H1SJ63]